MKNLFLLSVFLFLFSFQSKAQLNEALSATIIGTEILQKTVNEDRNLDPLILKVNEIQKKIYKLAQHNENFQVKLTELEKYSNEGNTEKANNLLKNSFGIQQSELDEIQGLAKQFSNGYKGSNEELEFLIERRVNSLKENNVLNSSYVPGEISGTAPSTNACCWCIAATTIVGSVASIIGGCALGPVGCAAGGVNAAIGIIKGSSQLCSSCGGCSSMY